MEEESQKVIWSQVGSRFCEVDRTVDDSRGLGKYSARCRMPRNAISQKKPVAEGEDIQRPIDWPYKLWSPVPPDVYRVT